jgi:hypothetical protein
MSTINQLTAIDTVTAGDLLVVYSQNNGDSRKAAISVLQKYMQNNLTFSSGFGAYTTQYSSPASSDFDIAVTDGDDDDENVHLILTPTGAFSDGAITLPASTSAVDKQEVLFNTTQAVTTFTVNGNGATSVVGAPTTLAANDFFRLKYDAATSNWYRVG